MNNSSSLPATYGYFAVYIKSTSPRRLLATNSERSFIISRLQDILTPRTTPYSSDTLSWRLTTEIDLLAFSVTGSHIKLLVFSTEKGLVTQLSDIIVSQLEWYRQEFCSTGTRIHPSHTTITQLYDSQQALHYSIELHLHHSDWEYDRYSSIGFYLHDRRGSWMRLWRLSKLYGNKPEQYRALLPLELTAVTS